MVSHTITQQDHTHYTVRVCAPATITITEPADPTISLYAVHRREALRVWAHVPPDLRTKGTTAYMPTCGRQLWFRRYLATGRRELLEARFCRHRLCPMCQWVRSVDLYRDMRGAVTMLPLPQRQSLYHVVLTVPSVPGQQLRPTLRRLIDAESAMARDLLRGRATGYGKVLLGRARGVEVTRNAESGLYHPHIHAIWAAVEDYARPGGPYIPQDALCALWGRYYGHGGPLHTWVSHIKPAGVSDASAELTKYMLKPGTIDGPQVYRDIYRATHGLRLWTTTGTIRAAIKAAEALRADIDHGTEGIDWVREWWVWYNSHGGYRQQDPTEAVWQPHVPPPAPPEATVGG